MHLDEKHNNDAMADAALLRIITAEQTKKVPKSRGVLAI
jgi:hypothetical protein